MVTQNSEPPWYWTGAPSFCCRYG